MTHNQDQATHDKEELHRDAVRQQIREVLQGCNLPVTVAYIVKQTGLDARQVRDVVLDMVAEGEASEKLWRYSL